MMDDYGVPLSQVGKGMMMAGSGEGLQYKFAPTADQAKAVLQQYLQQGFRGYVLPLGRDGSHEIRIWKDPQMPSLGPYNPYGRG